jgi:hypothetical protein
MFWCLHRNASTEVRSTVTRDTVPEAKRALFSVSCTDPNNPHLPLALGAKERIGVPDLLDEFGRSDRSLSSTPAYHS